MKLIAVVLRALLVLAVTNVTKSSPLPIETNAKLVTFFNPKEDLFAIKHGYTSSELYSVETGKMLHAFKNAGVRSVSPDGLMCAIQDCDDYRIKFFSIKNNEILPTTFDNVSGKESDLEFSPTGSILVITEGSNVCSFSVKLFEIATNKIVATFNKVRNEKFSPDGSILAIMYADNSIQLYNLETNKILSTFDNGEDIIFSADGSIAIIERCEKENSILFNVRDNKILPLSFKGHCHDVCISSDGLICAIRDCCDGCIKLFSVKDNEIILLTTFKDTRVAFIKHDKAKFSPDGSILAIKYKDGSVQLFNVKTNTTVATFDYVWDVKFSPDGSILALLIKHEHHSIQLYNLETNKIVSTFDNGKDIFFSADGSKLAIWDTTDHRIKLFKIMNKKILPITTFDNIIGVSINSTTDENMLAIHFIDHTYNQVSG